MYAVICIVREYFLRADQPPQIQSLPASICPRALQTLRIRVRCHSLTIIPPLRSIRLSVHVRNILRVMKKKIIFAFTIVIQHVQVNIEKEKSNILSLTLFIRVARKHHGERFTTQKSRIRLKNIVQKYSHQPRRNIGRKPMRQPYW